MPIQYRVTVKIVQRTEYEQDALGHGVKNRVPFSLGVIL